MNGFIKSIREDIASVRDDIEDVKERELTPEQREELARIEGRLDRQERTLGIIEEVQDE